jgi:hypothetical protein
MTKKPMPLWPPWRFRLYKWRHDYLPYRICVPWQEYVAEDGPYKAWRWHGREWMKSRWNEGRTRETVMRYRAARAAPTTPEFPPCDCRANDWVEGDNNTVRCVQCGGYAGEPGTSIRVVPAAPTTKETE